MKFNPAQLFKDFTSSEKNAGIILLVCTVISLFIANSPLNDLYLHFWHSPHAITLAGSQLHFTTEQCINDGLMTVFFLLVGLEIERELYVGELHPIKNAFLPFIAALGGMLVPAIIYIAINYKSPSLSGFGIPMGTDIAFALGVLSLSGKRVPVSIKILLTAIAIIDDLGSILIIAVFYGKELDLLYFTIAVVIFGGLLILNRLKVYNLAFYLLPGVLLWFCFLKTGIHPTISGVLIAFAIPFRDGTSNSPSIKLQHILHIPVAYFILPVFTLANTSINIQPEFIYGLLQPHSIGIALGLIIGKPLGIITATYACIKLKIVELLKKMVIGQWDMLSI